MKKILLLLSTIFLLNGCAESLALLGPGASNGRFFQSSLNSAISYGVKNKQEKLLWSTLLLSQKKKSREKKRNLYFFFWNNKVEFCTIVKKQIKSKSTAMVEKTTDFVKEFQKIKLKKYLKLKR